MGPCVRLVYILALVAGQTTQPATEAGIRAMVRGDYQTAVRILRPLADDAVRPDPVAQFFLALLYDTGHGVRPDMSRACVLFVRSGAATHPFSEQSAAIAALKREQLGGAGSPFCLADERWQGGAPQVFELGPDRRVVFTDTSVTVTNGDHDERMLWRWPADVRFLPILYTPLSVTRPETARRHFFQLFTWTPDPTASAPSWSLSWTLSEVVEDRFVPMAAESALVVVNAPAPSSTFDPATIVRLQVNAQGEAEFRIGGTSPRTGAIAWPGRH